MGISLHSGTNHARRRYFRSNSLDGTIPAALSALNLLRVLCARTARNAAPCACVQAPACLWVCKHPCVHPHALSHCHSRTLAARGREYAGSSPRQWRSAVGYSYHASRRYFDSNELDGTIPDSLSALNLLTGLCARPARMPRSAALGMRAVRVVHVRMLRLGFAAPWVPPAACGLQGGR
jgi:hypothetical protein